MPTLSAGRIASVAVNQKPMTESCFCSHKSPSVVKNSSASCRWFKPAGAPPTSRPHRVAPPSLMSQIFRARPVGHRASIFDSFDSDRVVFTIVDCGNPAALQAVAALHQTARTVVTPSSAAGACWIWARWWAPCPRIANYRSPRAADCGEVGRLQVRPPCRPRAG